MPPRSTETWARALADEGLTLDARDLADAIREGGHVTVFDEESAFHVHMKIARTAEERAEVEGATEVAYEGGRLLVAAPEDVIVWKLHFGTPQDIQDARGIVVRQSGKLDLDRMMTAAERLGVKATLESLLAENDDRTL